MIENKKGSGKGVTVPLLALVVSASFSMRSPMGVVGPLMTSLMEVLGLSAGEGGMLTTLPLLLFASGALIAVPLSERAGQGPLISFSFLVIFLGVVIRSLGSVFFLFAGTVLIGVGTGFLNVMLPSFFKEHYPSSSGFLMGLYSASLMFASAFTAAYVEPLEALSESWRTVFLSTSFFPLSAFLLFIPFSGKKAVKEEKSIEEKDEGRLLSGRNLMIALFSGIQSLIFFTILTWYPVIIGERGSFGYNTGILITITQAASLIPAYLIPVVTGRKNITLMSFLMPLLFIPGIITAYTAESGVVVALSTFLFGLSQGGTFSLGMILASVYGKNGHGTARIMSLSQFIGYILASAGPAGFGLLYDETGSWTMTVISLIVLSALMSAAALLVKRFDYERAI